MCLALFGFKNFWKIKGILKTGFYEWVYQSQCFSSLWCALVNSYTYDCCIYFWFLFLGGFFVLAMLSDIIRTWFWFISLTYLVLHKHFHGHFFHNVYFRPSLSADWTESTMLYIRPKMRAYRWRPLESLSLYPAYSWCFRCSIWDICSNTLPCKPEE